MRPLLTIMLPSRGRPEGLTATIESFAKNCRKESVEFILRLDDDDETLTVFQGVKTIIGPRLYGYESIHTFCNEMLLIATGQWIMLGNDDATMVTEGWDDILRQEKPRCILLNPNDENGKHAHIFPIVNKDVCMELGHFALNAFTDRWLQNVYGPAGLVKDIPIRIKHDIIKDQCSEDRRTGQVFSDKEWDELSDRRAEIINQLKLKASR